MTTASDHHVGRTVGAEGARQARDVMAFGQEVGRVLSDGRIVGRAEPFAKVFASSRVVKRAVGLAAWGVLEDIALDARLDDAGRLVAETNVRRIAANLALNKDTVSKHLRTLREYGFVLQEEERSDRSGRYGVCRYVLDPSACVERFTVTPPASSSGSAGQARPAVQTGRSGPCPGFSDTVPAAPVSEGTGHGGTGHGEPGHLCRDVVVPQDQQQHPARGGGDDDGLTGRLRALGITGGVATDLRTRHPVERLVDVVDAAEAQSLRKPAGWVVAALRDNWHVTEILAAHRGAQARQRAAAVQVEQDSRRTVAEQQRRDHTEAWAAALSAALDDRQLLEALTRVTTPTAGVGRRSVPIARAQLLAWALAVHLDRPDLQLPEALAAALPTAGPVPGALDGDLPDPPPPVADLRGELSARIAACLPAIPASLPAVAAAGSGSAHDPTDKEQP